MLCKFVQWCMHDSRVYTAGMQICVLEVVLVYPAGQLYIVLRNICIQAYIPASELLLPLSVSLTSASG